MNRFRIVSDGEFCYVEERIAVIGIMCEEYFVWKRLGKIKWRHDVIHNEFITEEQAMGFYKKVLRKREGLKVIKEL